MTKIYKPDSIRKTPGSNGPKYHPRTEVHDLCVAKIPGPRGGAGSWAIILPYGSRGGCTQGESSRAQAAREAQLKDALDRLLQQGWMLDRGAADKLSEVHAAARSAFHPKAGSQEQRQAARFAAADQAVRQAAKTP